MTKTLSIVTSKEPSEYESNQEIESNYEVSDEQVTMFNSEAKTTIRKPKAFILHGKTNILNKSDSDNLIFVKKQQKSVMSAMEVYGVVRSTKSRMNSTRDSTGTNSSARIHNIEVGNVSKWI